MQTHQVQEATNRATKPKSRLLCVSVSACLSLGLVRVQALESGQPDLSTSLASPIAPDPPTLPGIRLPAMVFIKLYCDWVLLCLYNEVISSGWAGL